MIRNILNHKCPNYGQGHIYPKTGWHFNIGSPKMNKKCTNCGYSFEKEPGFFIRAMYVSYALGVVQALLTYFIGRVFYEGTRPKNSALDSAGFSGAFLIQYATLQNPLDLSI